MIDPAMLQAALQGAAPTDPAASNATPRIPINLRTLPNDRADTVVALSEQIVKSVAQLAASSAKEMRRAVVGSSGRPFGHEKNTEEEALAQYQLMRDAGDPAVWEQQLDAADNPKKLVQSWLRFQKKLAEQGGSYGE